MHTPCDFISPTEACTAPAVEPPSSMDSQQGSSAARQVHTLTVISCRNHFASSHMRVTLIRPWWFFPPYAAASAHAQRATRLASTIFCCTVADYPNPCSTSELGRSYRSSLGRVSIDAFHAPTTSENLDPPLAHQSIIGWRTRLLRAASLLLRLADSSCGFECF